MRAIITLETPELAGQFIDILTAFRDELLPIDWETWDGNMVIIHAEDYDRLIDGINTAADISDVTAIIMGAK